MVKLGAYDITKYIAYGGITDGVEVVRDGQPYASPSGVQKEYIKGGHYSYQIKAQYITDSLKDCIDSLNNSSSFSCNVNGDAFSGYIQSISAVRNHNYWDMTITVIDLSLS